MVPEKSIYMHSLENLILHLVTLFTVRESSNWAQFCATIEYQISFVYYNFGLIESVKSNSIVSTCDNYIDSTCEIE